MIPSLFWLVIALLMIGFLVWLVDQIPVIAEPYKRIAKGVLVFTLVLWVIYMVATMFGAPPMLPWR